MKTVLFVTYGSGHVRMVVPVAAALARQGLVNVKILALTTAASAVAAEGLNLLQFKDFVTAADAGALEHGKRLMAELPGPVADPQETASYLGLSYAELVEDAGPEDALQAYRRDGRQAFLPLRTMQRIISRVAPALVVATNSPRAERAAITAAGRLGLPSICMVDLFCLDEVKWIGRPGYADRICVLTESVKQFLIGAGRSAADIVVTGNPAFDTLADPVHIERGRLLRQASGWSGKHVLLWPTQVEPAFHPFDGRPGNTALPDTALRCVIEWVLSRADCILCIRPRAGETAPDCPNDSRIVITSQAVGLPELLNAVDVVVTLNSTVGVEGYLAGTRVVQILGSVFDNAMPLKHYGIADEAVGIEALVPALERCISLPRRLPGSLQGSATTNVVDVIREFL